MPWAPRPQTSNPFAWARVLASYGYSRAEIVDRLRLTYNTPGAPLPGIRESDVQRAATAGVLAAQRIKTLMNAGNMQAKPSRAASFYNPNINDAHRYHILFSLPPDAQGNREHLTVIVTSARILTLQQIHDAALSTFAEIADHYRKFAKANVNAQTDWTLTLHERRSR